MESSEPSDDVLGIKFCKASDMIESSVLKCHPSKCPSIAEISGPSHKNIPSLDEHLLTIIRKYGERIILTESDRKPRNSRRKGKQLSSMSVKSKKHLEINGNWQGLAPWDSSVGGDGCPKFLCDIMVWIFSLPMCLSMCTHQPFAPMTWGMISTVAETSACASQVISSNSCVLFWIKNKLACILDKDEY